MIRYIFSLKYAYLTTFEGLEVDRGNQFCTESAIFAKFARKIQIGQSCAPPLKYVAEKPCCKKNQLDRK